MAKEQTQQTSASVMENSTAAKRMVKRSNTMSDFDAISLRLASPEKII
jgi:hypothetical protein